MKTQLFKSVKILAVTGALAVLCPTFNVSAGVLPPESHAYGRTLAQWNDLYTRWAFGDATLPTDANGNAVVNDVVLWPTPLLLIQSSGHSDVTINSGEAFMMPVYGWLGTSYLDGTPDDTYLRLTDFIHNSLTVKIDGVTVINNANKLNFFTEFHFRPQIPLPQPDFYPFNGIIYEQSIGFVHTPLTPGKHKISVDASIYFPDSNPTFGPVEWHYTWSVTVRRQGGGETDRR